MKIKSIKKIKNDSKLYDIQTTSENFYANEILIHNSMIRTLPLNGGFRLGTRAGITDVSENAEAFIADKPQYGRFINYCIENDLTPIFEWVSRKNRIVIDYPEDQLILTGIRCQWSGTYFQYEIMVSYANAWNIPVIKAIAGGEKNLQNIVDHIRTWHDSEGVIIRFNYDGHMVKIKSLDYVLRHKYKDAINQEKNVIEILMNGSLDDIIPLLTAEDVERIRNFEKAFWKSLEDVATDIHDAYKKIDNGQDQKEFATVSVPSVLSHYQYFMFKLRKGIPIRDLLIEQISKSLSSQSKIDSARWMWNNLRWNN